LELDALFLLLTIFPLQVLLGEPAAGFL